VVVLPANVQDRDGAKTLFTRAAMLLTTLKTIWADGAYAGLLIEWLKNTFGWTLEIVKRLKDAAGFIPLRKRWIVERTISWLNHARRLSKDYEYLTESSEAMVNISAGRMMLHRRYRPRDRKHWKKTSTSS
jgi:putative transposase